MKHFFLRFLIVIASLTTVSCTYDKHPELINVENVKLKEFTFGNITITADGIFKNPNDVGGVISLEDLHVVFEDINLGIIQSEKFDIPSQGEFTVPIKGKFNINKIVKDQKIEGGIRKLFKLASQKSFKVQIKGNVRYHLGDYHYDYPVDMLHDLKLN